LKILVTGAKGQLGEIVTFDLSTKYTVYPFSSMEMDITDRHKVQEIVKDIKPNVLINCASYNKVDKAEEDRQSARDVNTTAVGYLADICESIKCKIVHISTDYVFDGEKKRPYQETDMPNPINYYGQTKRDGEKMLEQVSTNYLLIRTAWLYSYSANNFVYNIQQIAKQNRTIRVINDQIGTPTNAYELSKVIKKLILDDAKGLYHCTGNGSCSWYEFAKAIIAKSGIDCKVNPISSKDYKQAAPRPKFSVLENKRLKDTIGDTMSDWDKALDSFFKMKSGKI
jgi:dTDP-4-dehydrorhamnose reductase